jgi:TnsA endonuclease N terminal
VLGSSRLDWKAAPDLYPPYLRARIRRGCGIGDGASYRPWFRIRDVPSAGTCSAVLGILTGRAHQLRSELETTYFFLMERRRTTVDLRERWPILNLHRTLELCADLGVRHAGRWPYPEPFTLDLMITESLNGTLVERAACIKTTDDAAKPTVRLRLAVEYAWCRERKVPWTLVDTSAFDKQLLDNLRFMRAWFRNRYEPDQQHVRRFAQVFQDSYRTNIPLTGLIQRVAKALRLSGAAADNQFRYCAWYDMIPVSLQSRLSMSSPLVLRRPRERV